jgi:hypothetical protein
MLFYILLVIACIVVALVVLRLFRMIEGSRRVFFKPGFMSSMPIAGNHSKGRGVSEKSGLSSKERVRSNYLKFSKFSGVQAAKPENPVPWGWPGNKPKSRETRPKTASSDGMDLNSYLARNRDRINSVRNWEQNVSQPARDRIPPALGNIYKSDRTATPVSSKRKKEDRIIAR